MSSTALATNVPACPRWSVRDVLAHLATVAEDAVAGRLSPPPSEDETDHLVVFGPASCDVVE